MPATFEQQTSAARGTNAYLPFWAISAVFLPMNLKIGALISNDLCELRFRGALRELFFGEVSPWSSCSWLYFVEDFRERSRIQSARAQLVPVVNKARTISETTEGVGCELIELAPAAPKPAKIVSEFKIQFNQPP